MLKKTKPAPKRWFIYILRTKTGQLYTGMTNDVARRIEAHCRGRGARFTRMFGVDKLLYSRRCASRRDAMRREAEVKRWPRDKKLKLIEGKRGLWKTKGMR